jgi:hypothetical protein
VTSSLLFSNDKSDEADEVAKSSMATAAFGERVNGRRYKMPLLPGESGPKSGGDWVPYGIQSCTNLAGAISDTRLLGDWERERTQIGLGLRPDLTERLAFITARARAAGVDFNNLRESDAGQQYKVEVGLIHAEAKDAAGANVFTVQGTNRHDVWEERGKSGLLFGGGGIAGQIEKLEALLERKGLRRVPGLQERTIRNVALRAAGRFDDVLQATRDIVWSDFVIPAGMMLMADLKTKRRPFWSMQEVRIQLAVYASAEYMLDHPHHTDDPGEAFYVPGPVTAVSQEWGVIMRMPSDGGEPELIRANLTRGLADARLARQVCDSRSDGKSKAALDEAVWPDEQIAIGS